MERDVGVAYAMRISERDFSRFAMEKGQSLQDAFESLREGYVGNIAGGMLRGVPGSRPVELRFKNDEGLEK